MKESREIIQKPIELAGELERPFEAPFASSPGRYPAYREFHAQDSFQLLDYWNAIRKRLWLVIGITLLITTLTAIYISKKPDIYQAKAVVQVDLEQANPDLQMSDRRMPVSADPSYFNTQLQLLTSESLLRRVVKEHSLDTNKDFQQSKNDNAVSPWRSMLKTVGLASEDKPKETKAIGEVSPISKSSIASSEEVAEAIRLAPYVDILQKNIIVDPVRESRATFKDTRLIEVSFRHTDPELAAFIVNSIVETFSKTNQEKRSGTNRKTNDFLEKRVADLQTQIKSDEQKLFELNKDAGIVSEGESTIVVARLSGLNKQLLEAENLRKNAEAQYLSVSNSPDSLKSMVEDQMGRYISERENYIQTTTNDAQKKIADLKAQRAKLLEEYQESADVVKEVDKQITSLQNSIDQTVKKNESDLQDYRKRQSKVQLDQLKTKYIQAKDTEDKIRSAYNTQFSQAQGQDQAAVNIKILQQNIETNKGFLKNLQTNQSENDVIALGTDNNISVAEISIPPTTPIAPRRLTTVIAAMFLSTLFGLGLALFLEYLDDSIRTTEEIENYLQLPALAAIPTIDSAPKRRLLLVGANAESNTGTKSELLINSDRNSALGEAYRQLRTSILLSTAGHAPKSLLITSSLPSEGKTTTAINTAISLAQTGARVLIIDADMRRPRLHNVFEISNAMGLSTLLSSNLDEQSVLETVQYDEETKLSMITSGPIPPNPAELIGSEQMTDLMKILQEKYTHVVVDSPPIASFTDGVLIASMVDGVLLVVHANKSSKQIVRRSRQLLQDVGARIFGVVLNNINLSSQNNNYYYQSYYYRNNYSKDRDKE